MTQSTAKCDNKLNIIDVVGEKASCYFYGKTFPFQIALTVALCYLLDLALVALLIISFLASFVFLFYKNLAPIIPLLFMAVFPFRNYDVMSEIWAYVVLMPAIASFIARFFIHPIKWHMPGKLFIPLILICFALALGGALRPNNNFLYGIAQFISLGPTILFVYLFFTYNISLRNGFCVKRYLCYSLVAAGLAITLEVFFFRYIIDFNSHSDMGWANVNTCAAFLLLSIPACYYLIIKAKSAFPLIVILLLLYIGVVLTGSTATLGFAIAYSPILMIYTYRHIYRANRIIFSYSIALVIILVASLIIVLTSLFGIEKALILLNIDPSENGREGIYKEAIRLFKENPIFGYGFQYNAEEGTSTSLSQYNFHSTLFHAMATMGIFGVFAYGIYVIVRLIILMKHCSPFTTMMLIAFIMFESYSMIDNCEINAIPLMCTVTVIISVTEFATKKDNASSALPLSTNKRHGYNF